MRFYAATGRGAVPYVDAAFSGWGKDDHTGREVRGTAFTAGTGMELFWVDYMSLDVGVRHSRGKFDEARVDGRPAPGYSLIRGSTTRFMIGVKRRPPRSR